MNSKRYLIVLALLVIAGAWGWWARDRGEDNAATSAQTKVAPGVLTASQISRLGIKTAVAIETDATSLGSVPAIVTLPPEARVAVTAPFTGSVIRLYVVVGQAVRRGQPLAVLRSREPLQYGAELARAQARLGLAQASAARTGQLAREGIVAGARADEAQASLRQAQVDVSENNRVLAQSGAGANGEIVLRAPITGRLALINVQTGGPVDGMTAPFVVENDASFMLDLQLPERMANSVFPGMQVEVPVPGGAPIIGSVVSVGSSIDPATRSVLAKARIGAAPMLVSGKSVMAVLKGKSQIPGTTVPAAAVTRIGDKDMVFVKTRTGFVKRVVTVSGRIGEQVLISGGIKPGEHVATSGISELKVILSEG
ncbi:efflux RND transporter periplasmic adaptor subunit [Sphingopyxis sp.]|uniref:efflux RND transporter periplasmic adaptor subunit n=1 Tax=Sphingopyxis sp. TaxID=1908224 RepID=UPI001DF17C39|nr:efflux RND transporter periplasmic adaptor subunit [Sphingopyxis sp.]MBW8294497.1 efflux RND transporter periplasmic adaptor subunit [Sphingopyxis sp.]